MRFPLLIREVSRFVVGALRGHDGRRVPRWGSRGSEAMARFAIDSLSAHVAILDSTGDIIAVNRAWTDFGGDGIGSEARGVGANYLRVCDSAAATGAGEAASFARGIRDVLSGRKTYFEMEYPCPTPAARRWFVGRVTPFPGSSAPGVVVAHEDVTERKRAELALEASEDRLRLALEAASLGIWYQDLRTGEFIVLPDTAAMHGLSADAPLDQAKALAAVHPEDRDRVAALVKRAIGTGGSFEAEYRITRPDGTIRWMLSRARVYQNGERRLIGVAQDITPRKEAERSLLVQAQLLDQVRASVIATDMDGAVIHWNRHAEKLYGWTRQEVLGRNILELTVGPTDAEVAEKIMALLRDGRPWEGEFETRRKDGSTFPAYVVDALVYGDDGRPVGMVGVSVDLTSRKEAERALRESEARFRLLAEKMGDLVCLHEPDGRYLYLSPSCSRLLGYDPEELLGTDPYELFHPDDRTRIWEEAHEKALDGQAAVTIIYRIRKKDGEYTWFETLTEPILDGEGTVVRLQTSSRDVTERKRAEEALAAAARQKTEFLAEVSHELRTPLTVIRGNAEIGLEMEDGCDHGDLLKEVVREASTMSRMVEDLLFLARSESSTPPFRMEPVAVETLLVSLARRAGTLAAKHGATLETSQASSGLVRVDPARIEQAVLALVDNAGKYGKNGGRIALGSTSEEGRLRIEVSDQGPGIPPDDLPHVFERFYRGEGAAEPGNGLGLSIASTILRAHGGRIEAESEPGRGTRVSILLPLLPAAE